MACRNFYCVETITVGTENVTLAFDTVPTIADESRICFRLKDKVPATSANLPVVVSINATTVPLLNRFGNPIIGSDLRINKIYKGLYGATSPCVIIENTPLTVGCK